MIKSQAGELSSDGDGRAEKRDGGGGGGLSLGVSKPHCGGGGGLSPMAQATIEKHLSGQSKRILLTQTMNKKSQSKDMGTITGNNILYAQEMFVTCILWETRTVMEGYF